MGSRTRLWVVAGLALACGMAQAQVFVVGEKTATDSVVTDFHKTNVELQSTPLTEMGRRTLVRMMEAEQGFAHRGLPMGGPGLLLHANGPLVQSPEEYKKMLFTKGQSAAPGDRVVITAIVFEKDRIIFDLNGGPFLKHRFLRHLQINDNNVVRTDDEKATGARVVLLFERFVPEITAAEVKNLLDPVIDFGIKTSEQAYADTLPGKLKDAIAEHQVLVGMNRRMVLAALGAPDSKVRDKVSGELNAAKYEEWIYGHVPQTVKFVRFVGDRVVMLEIAALGKPMEIRDKDEVGELMPVDTRVVALGEGDPTRHVKPTLRKDGDPQMPANNEPTLVQLPGADKKDAPAQKPPQFVGDGATR